MWMHNFDGIYLVKFGCRIMNSTKEGSIQIQIVDWTSIMLWQTWIPPRIHAFSWRLFLINLSKKDILLARGIRFDAHSSSFVLFFREKEDLNHLLLSCSFSLKSRACFLPCLEQDSDLSILQVLPMESSR